MIVRFVTITIKAAYNRPFRYQKCCWKSSNNDYTPGQAAISKT